MRYLEIPCYYFTLEGDDAVSAALLTVSEKLPFLKAGDEMEPLRKAQGRGHGYVQHGITPVHENRKRRARADEESEQMRRVRETSEKATLQKQFRLKNISRFLKL